MEEPSLLLQSYAGGPRKDPLPCTCTMSPLEGLMTTRVRA